ncbi:polysaccharide biosynthesis protein [bacterium]|nr:polysaccharide biosynthesis protein [bacterium]
MKLNNQPAFRMLAKLGLDTLSFLAAIASSYFIRFPVQEAVGYLNQIIFYIPAIVAIRLSLFAAFRLYSSFWRYSSVHDLKKLLKAATAGSLAIILLEFIADGLVLSRLIIIMEWMLVMFFAGSVRLTVRLIADKPRESTLSNPSMKRVLIYGAGRAGELLLRNINNTSNALTGVDLSVVGFVDDDTSKRGKYVHNKQVIGTGDDIRDIVLKNRVTDIYFAISSLSGVETRRILNLIREQIDEHILVKTIPGLRDLVHGRVSVNQLRGFEINDLLRRKPVHLDFRPVEKMIYNRRVMVVGGGGSIGKELCNQIARFHPEELIIFDSSEFNVYAAEAMLQGLYPKLNIICLVADAANEVLIRKAFDDYEPDIVFHAAAYKHVPLMEVNPWAAIINNIRSTLNLVQLSEEFKVERFILISTDKAVQPSSIMGVTKRICELIALHQAKISDTHFMAVRFGNVLGSSGSVIPKFKNQIEQGGPITVTHPEITRYFMLISEAVELVLQAGAVGKNGNIYVLDMGSPIKIVDLAKYMIELSGLKVNEDIPIVYSGLRPGEKLHESLYLEGEESKTTIPNLFVLEPQVEGMKEFMIQVNDLLNRCQKMDAIEVRQALKSLIIEYQPDASYDSLLKVDEGARSKKNGDTPLHTSSRHPTAASSA